VCPFPRQLTHSDALLTARMRSRRELDLKVSHLQMGCGPWQMGQVDWDWNVVNACLRGASCGGRGRWDNGPFVSFDMGMI
jgi:hypothetical protein